MVNDWRPIELEKLALPYLFETWFYCIIFFPLFANTKRKSKETIQAKFQLNSKQMFAIT